MTRRRLARAGLGLVIAGAVLWIAEIACRLAGLGTAYQADAIGGWRMMPEMRAQTITGTKEAHRFVVTTNRDGLRTSLPRARTPGVARVAVMGDSTVFGWGADEGGTVADGIAAGLAARGIAAEVLNAGQPGYTTTQVATFFRDVVAAYRPDAVVVFLPMHDDNRVLVSDREHLDGARGPAATVRVALATHSRVYQALRQAIFPLAAEPFLVPGMQRSAEPRVPRVSDAERDENMDGMRAILAEWGGVLAVGHLPFLDDLRGRSFPRFTTAWADAYAARTGTPIVDLRACCASPDAEALVLPYDRGHLTAEGNVVVGRAAAEPVSALLTGAIAASRR
ncbi:MAG: SGNH/GDSL hydrolase family protein [Myxococcota bacterium]